MSILNTSDVQKSYFYKLQNNEWKDTFHMSFIDIKIIFKKQHEIASICYICSNEMCTSIETIKVIFH